MKTTKPAQPRTSKRKVMVVDDHPLLRGGLASVINAQEDLKVCCEAADAGQALQHLQAERPDLAVVDLSLEGKSGLELIKDMRGLYSELPILVMSIHDETLYAERVLRAGARGYVMKRAGGEVVLEAIRRVLDGHVYLSARMSDHLLAATPSRQRGHNSPIQRLTDREFEVFELMGKGLTTKAISQRLHLSTKTVDVHRSNIREKLGMPDTSSLVRHAVRWLESDRAGA